MARKTEDTTSQSTIFDNLSVKQIVFIAIFLQILAFLLANYISHIFQSTAYMIAKSVKFDGEPLPPADYSLSNFLAFDSIYKIPVFFWPVFLALTFIVLRIVYIWYKKHSDMNYNEYGNSRWTNDDEIFSQYTTIPSTDVEFKGIGGVPVTHHLVKNKTGRKLKKDMGLKLSSKTYSSVSIDHLVHKNDPFFEKIKHRAMFLATLGRSAKIDAPGVYSIDQDTVNTIVIGITRSGKGETFVNPLVDILSRAEEKSSMIINDPKGELFQMSYKTLRKRGYNVNVLNLLNMPFSMSYNPLQVPIDYAQRGYTDKTQEAVNSITTSIYNKPGQESGGSDAFWVSSSINLLNAIIFALIDQSRRKIADDNIDTSNLKELEQAYQNVTLWNAVQMLNRLGASEITVNEKPKSKLSAYFEQLMELPDDPFRTMAFNAFQQSNFAGDETTGSIYSSTLEGVKLFLQTDIARLTSKNQLDLTDLGMPRRLRVRVGNGEYNYETVKVTFLDQNGNEIEKLSPEPVDEAGLVNVAIKSFLPDKFTVEIRLPDINKKFVLEGAKKYKKDGLKFLLDKFSKDKVLKSIDLTAKDNAPLFDGVMNYSEKATALFIVTPPHNPAYNILGSFIVDQAFNLNYEAAVKGGRKLVTRTHFILDEFGNLPPINAMDKKVSIGLGQGLLFDIVVQNLEQLKINYSEQTAATIKSNMGNTLYILTKSNETAKEISDLLGSKTITVRTRSGLENGSLEKGSVGESRIGQELMNVSQLLNLQTGEMVVMRATHRSTLKGENVRPRPIQSRDETTMPQRWQFMKTTFDQDTTLGDLAPLLESSHRNLNIGDVTGDFDQEYMNLVGRIKLEKFKTEGENMGLDGEDLTSFIAENVANTVADPVETRPAEWADQMDDVSVESKIDSPIISGSFVDDDEFVSILAKVLNRPQIQLPDSDFDISSLFDLSDKDPSLTAIGRQFVLDHLYKEQLIQVLGQPTFDTLYEALQAADFILD